MSALRLGIASAAALFLASGTAQAEVTLIDGSGLEFYITDSVTTLSTSYSYSTSGVQYYSWASGAASDASYTQAVPSTTTSGATYSTTLGDAFDGYNAVRINGTVYSYVGPAKMECKGREAGFAPMTIGNLAVSRRVFVPEDDAFIRFLTIVTNNGSKSEVVTFDTKSNMGSDSSTVILGSSSGDTAASTDDLWIATGGDYDDPRVAHVFSNGMGTVALSSLAVGTPYADDIQYGYEFTLAPGETGVIMHLASGQATNAAAVSRGPELLTPNSTITQCMDQVTWDQVLNFGIDCSAMDDVCIAGYYDPSSGLCEAAAGFEGESCDDGDECTINDVCSVGTCAGEEDPECGQDTGEPNDTDDPDDNNDDDDSDDTGSGKDDSSGCSTLGAGSPGLIALGLLGLAAIRRRRR